MEPCKPAASTSPQNENGEELLGQMQALDLEPTSVGKVHPLLVDIVLDKIFRYLIRSTDVNDVCHGVKAADRLPFSKTVLSYRLVCKHWRDRVTEIIAVQRPPATFGIPQLEYVGGTRPTTTGLPELTRFVNIMKNSAAFIVRRYAFEGGILVPGNRNVLTDFLKFCAPEATELKLNIFEWEHLKKQVDHFTTVRLDKLKKLEIFCQVDSEADCLNELCTLAERILRGAPQLEEFFFDPQRDWFYDSIGNEKLESVLMLIPNTLKEFDLRSFGCLSDSHLKILTGLGLKLEKCDINMFTCSKEISRAFLAQQSPTLESLTVDAKAVLAYPNFPIMKNLTHLAFNADSGLEPDTTPDAPFELDVFPNLNVIKIYSLRRTDSQIILSSEKQLFSVQEVHLTVSSSNSFPVIQKAAHCFPNTKKLDIVGIDLRGGLAAQTLPDVFAHFLQVEELIFLMSGHERLILRNLHSFLLSIPETDWERTVKKDEHGDMVLNMKKL